MGLEKIVFVTKKTPLEKLLEQHSTMSQVKFYLESRGESFEEYKKEDEVYRKVVSQIRQSIPSTINQQSVEKEKLNGFSPDKKSLITVIGGSGLVINAAKYMASQPIISLNPDPQRLGSTFTTAPYEKLIELVEKAFIGELEIEAVTMAKAVLDDGQEIEAVNDLFIGRRTHVSAKYLIRHKNNEERHSSSGIIVSTGAGSTGWLSAIYGSAQTLSNVKEKKEVLFARNSDYLRYVVREPFVSRTAGAQMIEGMINYSSPLEIVSHMSEDGVIFSDGIEDDYITFNAGMKVKIIPSDKKFNLVRG